MAMNATIKRKDILNVRRLSFYVHTSTYNIIQFILKITGQSLRFACEIRLPITCCLTVNACICYCIIMQDSNSFVRQVNRALYSLLGF